MVITLKNGTWFFLVWYNLIFLGVHDLTNGCYESNPMHARIQGFSSGGGGPGQSDKKSSDNVFFFFFLFFF